MSTKHTPGPWKWDPNDDADQPIVYVDLPEDRAGPDAVSVLFYADWATPGDARLIAQAPRMLDALQRLTHPMADDSDVEYAREVIAQALGDSDDESETSEPDPPPLCEGCQDIPPMRMGVDNMDMDFIPCPDCGREGPWDYV